MKHFLFFVVIIGLFAISPAFPVHGTDYINGDVDGSRDITFYDVIYTLKVLSVTNLNGVTLFPDSTVGNNKRLTLADAIHGLQIISENRQPQVLLSLDNYLDTIFLKPTDSSITALFDSVPVAKARHPITGYYEIPMDKTAYDVDESKTITSDELTAEINTNDLTTWPNVINLTRLLKDNQTLLESMMDELAKFDPGQIISSAIMPAISAGTRIFLARDFITFLEKDTLTYTEVPYFLFLDLDAKDISGVIEIQGYNESNDFPDTPDPVVHDPHTEDLRQLFIENTPLEGALWYLCLRGNEKKEKYQALVVSKDDADNFQIEKMTGYCDIDNAMPEFPFNPPEYPRPRPDGSNNIPIQDEKDALDPNLNPNMNLPGNNPPNISGVPEPADTIIAEDIVPVDPDPVIPEEENSEGEPSSGEPCCDNWNNNPPDPADIQNAMDRLAQAVTELEYWDNPPEALDPALQDIYQIQDEMYRNYFAELKVYSHEMELGLGFDSEYDAKVVRKLNDLIANCGICELNERTASRTIDGVEETATVSSLECDIPCDGTCPGDGEGPLDNPDYKNLTQCLNDALNDLSAQIQALRDTISQQYQNYPDLRLAFVRETIWSNIFYQGVDRIFALSFCAGADSGPSVAGYDVTAFLDNVVSGIVTREESVDNAIENAIDAEVEKAPDAEALIRCSLGQLKQSLKQAYERELSDRDYTEAQKEILMNKNMPPDMEAAMNTVIEARKELHFKHLLKDKIKLALLNLRQKTARCARTYAEHRHCLFDTVKTLMGTYQKSVSGGELTFHADFKTFFDECDPCKVIQELACCFMNSHECSAECSSSRIPDCCSVELFQNIIGSEVLSDFIRYLICFGKSAEDAKGGIFCPNFSFEIFCQEVCYF